MGWTTAAMILITLFVLLTTVFFCWRAVAEMPREASFWLIPAALVSALGGLLWGTIARLRREAKAPGAPAEPSLLRIADGVLKVERAGPGRGMDYSWEFSEIADLCMSNTSPDRASPSVGSLVRERLAHDQMIRISVARKSGEVDDINILSAGQHWASSLETRLRDYLKRSTGAAKT